MAEDIRKNNEITEDLKDVSGGFKMGSRPVTEMGTQPDLFRPVGFLASAKDGNDIVLNAKKIGNQPNEMFNV